MQTHLLEDTASKSLLYSQNITSLIFAVLFLKEYGQYWKKRKWRKQNVVEQINWLHKVFLNRSFYVLGGKGKGKNSCSKPCNLHLESEGVPEDKSWQVHSSATILFMHNRSHKANALRSELNVPGDRLSNTSRVLCLILKKSGFQAPWR